MNLDANFRDGSVSLVGQLMRYLNWVSNWCTGSDHEEAYLDPFFPIFVRYNSGRRAHAVTQRRRFGVSDPPRSRILCSWTKDILLPESSSTSYFRSLMSCPACGVFVLRFEHRATTRYEHVRIPPDTRNCKWRHRRWSPPSPSLLLCFFLVKKSRRAR